MAVIYRHLAGESDSYPRVVSIIATARKTVVVKTLLLTNTCDSSVTCDLFIRKTSTYTTHVDSEGKRLSGNIVNDDYYLFKNIEIPEGSSINVIEMTGTIEYEAGRSLQVSIEGNNTKTLDLILTHE